MIKKACLCLIFLFSFSNSVLSQEKGIRIVEKVEKKRTLIYAENTTEVPKVMFFKVNPTGYRRRSHRPLIKTIPPKTKKFLITLIPLTDVESSYTYEMVVNNEIENINATVNKKSPPKE